MHGRNGVFSLALTLLRTLCLFRLFARAFEQFYHGICLQFSVNTNEMAKRDFFFSISLSLFKYTSLSSIFERWFYSSCQLEMMNSTDDTAHKQISTVINRFLCSGMYLMDAPHVRQYNSIQMWNEQYKREFRLVLVSFQNKNCFSIFIFILFLSFNFTYTHTHWSFVFNK